ncbi:MAG: hypothetical protein ABL893_02705 [Hyphomicrobium sp.]
MNEAQRRTVAALERPTLSSRVAPEFEASLETAARAVMRELLAPGAILIPSGVFAAIIDKGEAAGHCFRLTGRESRTH